MSLESFMTANFEKAARERETEMKGKKYTYKLFSGRFMDNLCAQGICVVLSRKYELSCDCDIITVQDVDTLKVIIGNQFSLILE